MTRRHSHIPRKPALQGTEADARMRAEEALRNETHLRSVIRATPVVLWDVDCEGTVLLSEGSALAKLGVAPGELVGKSMFEVYKDAPEVLAHVRRGLAGEEISVETRIADTFWSTHFVPRRDEGGNICGLLGVSVDISDRKRAEEALREGEQKYRVLFDREVFAICLFDVETLEILDVNAAYVRLYGYGKDELMSGMTILDLIADREEFAKVLAEIRQGKETQNPLRYHRKKDGMIFPVTVVSTPCVWKGRKVCFGSILDITQRTLAEEKQARTQYLLEISQRLAHIGSWEYELATGAFSWSDEMYRIAGLPVGTPLSRDLVESFFPAAELARSRETLANVVDSETPYCADYTVKRRDGQFIVIHNEGEVVRDDDGRAVRVSGTTQDITGRRQAEDALRETSEMFALFMHHSPIYAYIKEVTPTKSRVLHASENFIDMVGVAGSQMTGKAMEELFPPEFAAKITADDWDVVSRGEAQSFEEELNGRSYTTLKFPMVQNGKRLLAGYTIDISENKRMEKTLVESEQKYRLLHESAGIGIAYYTADGTVISYNRVAAKLMNGRPEDFEGKSIFDIFEKGEAESYYQRIKKAEVSENPVTYEEAIALPSGTKSFLSTFSRIVDSRGTTLGVQIISQDISDLKKAEEALLDSQRQIEFILGATKTGLDIIDADFNIHYVDPQWSKVYGKWEGRKCYEYFESRADPRRDCSFQRALETKQVSVTEHMLSREGNRPVQITAIPYQDKDGKWFVAEVSVDMRERKKIEEALRENEEKLRASETKYRQLIETAPEAIYVVEDEKVVFCNEHALETLGYSREEMLGMAMEKINYSEDWQEARGRYLARAEGKSLSKSVTRHVTKEGKAIWVECVGERMEWEGRPAVLYFSSDVTERKNAEDNKAKMEQYLQQAQRLESLGVLAGGIAHDFNNILMGVFGFADLAKNQIRDETASEYLAQALKSMERAKALTQQLLTFSKGGAPVKRISSLGPLLNETCAFALHGSNVKCDLSVPEDLWRCNVDRNQIGQVIENLMINAIQAMPLGGVIHVAARNVVLREKEHPTLEHGRYVLVSIKDQGTGISREMLPRIFDPFFTTKTQGHGLGLSIAYSIVNRHDGAINVQSELGNGTTFALYFPACEGSEIESDDRVPAPHAGSGRILVMDDDESVRTLVTKMLQSCGYTVVGTTGGKETIETFVEDTRRGKPFAGMILDLTIPGGSGGKEVAEEIRKTDAAIPLFVSSGYAGDPILADPTAYGFDAALSKPYKMAELMEVLEKHIKRSR